MKTVSYFWRIFAIFLIGFAFGILLSFHYLQSSVPSGQSVEIGKIKIKGKSNKLDNEIIITKTDVIVPKKKKRKQRKH